MEDANEVVSHFLKWNELKIRLHFAEPKIRYYREREIWWVSLGANIGSEQNGKNTMYERPVLILKKFNQLILRCSAAWVSA